MNYSEIEGEIMAAKKPVQKEQTRIRTGSTLLDLVIGGGEGLGLPPGKILNVVGDKSSGKTFLGCEIIAKNYHTYKKKFVFNYDDCEDGFTFNTESLYGINIMNEDTFQSSKVQDFDVHCSKFLKKVKPDQIGVYVLDSLDALNDDTKEERSQEREKNYDKGKGATNKSGTYSMESQKFLSQEFFRLKTREFASTNSSLIIISQVRDNINAGLFGKKHTRAGGKALDFYAHTCLWLATVSKIKRKDTVVGIVVEATTEKSKTPRPFRSCRFVFYFDYGIDNIGSNLDYLFDLRGKDGKLLSAANSIIWDSSKKEYNLSNLKKWLEENKLLDTIRDERKKAEGKGNLSLEWTQNWIDEQPDQKKEFEKQFGAPISRKELISKIENDPKLEKELEERVIQKWEDFEDSIKVNRKRKYE